jgi:hypothetical protein
VPEANQKQAAAKRSPRPGRPVPRPPTCCSSGPAPTSRATPRP